MDRVLISETSEGDRRARENRGAAGTPSKPLDRSATVYVAGHRGLVGSAMWRHLERSGFTSLVGRSSAELDLRERADVFDFFADTKPDVVILAAAKVGGIAANNASPADFLSDNMRIEMNVLDAARSNAVERLLFLGSSCIYPAASPQPIREDYLMTGHLEPTNDGYAIAKIAGILYAQSVRRQDGLPWISAMPTNLYGPGDNFSAHTSHVLPALIRRYEEAARTGSDRVVNWGSGSPRREFLHVDDMAAACLHLLENYDSREHVNVGTGADHEIREIAQMVADAVGYEGVTEWDSSKPDGMRRKMLDISTITSSGWTPKIELRAGIADTVDWFRSNLSELRV